VKAILETVGAEDTNRKQLFEKLLNNGAAEDAESRRMMLAADLHWLINEGYVIEFNDGSLDLPRAKSRLRDGSPAEAASPGSSSKPTVETRQLALALPRTLALYSPTTWNDGTAESPSL
jgi:hypothetical protein